MAKTDKPNILIIWGDDIGWFNVSMNNNGIMGYRTPNIDRVAKEGATSPTGTDSRAALPAAPHSSRGSRRSAPASRRSVCQARTLGSDLKIRRSQTC